MITTLLLEIKVFLFIMAIFVILAAVMHVVSVFRFKNGKIVSNERGLTLFLSSVAYIITMLICGF